MPTQSHGRRQNGMMADYGRPQGTCDHCLAGRVGLAGRVPRRQMPIVRDEQEWSAAWGLLLASGAGIDGYEFHPTFVDLLDTQRADWA